MKIKITLFFMIVLLSCFTNKELIVKKGIIKKGNYTNKSVGVSVDFNDEKWSAGYSVQMEYSNYDTFPLSNRHESPLKISFRNKQEEILLRFLNSKKIKISEVKDYLSSEGQDQVTYISKSEIEEFKIGKVSYCFYEETYRLKGFQKELKVKYAYKKHNDLILLFQLNPACIELDTCPEKAVLIEFLKGGISYF